MADLLRRLTLEEKFSLCAGKGLWSTKPVKRLGIKSLRMTDGPHGVSALGSFFKKCTYFPTSICRAATWNLELSKRFGAALAEEARSIGCNVVLAPGVNIVRTPLCGRTFEYQTEDPYLNSKMTVAVVSGIQSKMVAACVKHFACNNQETNRRKVSAEVGERALREIYLPAFEAAVKEADAWSVMASYNKVNGTYSCENRNLLVERLREEWGFRGFVVSDWYAASSTSGTEGCVNGGLSLEMPGKGKRYKAKALRRAFEEGRFSEDALDRNLAGLLRAMFLVGMFDDERDLPKGSRNTPEHRSLAREIAEEGIVLLKNEGESLPLKEGVKRVAALGPNADKKTGFGGGSSMVRPLYEITPLRGLEERCRGKATIVREPKDADAAIVFAGFAHSLLKGTDYEGKDRRGLDLPEEQIDLIQETAEANPRTIVVLVNGGPIAMDAWIGKVPAVVEAWYAGLEAGRAIASILFGDVNPSGKLPLTFPKKLSDSPAHASERTFPGGEKVYYDEGVFVGYRHFDAWGIEPLFPFGHGLSYTQFLYENLGIKGGKVSGENTFEVSLEVTNVGGRPGSEVVQLYVQDVEASVERPPKELKGFEKVRLEPRQKEKVAFTLGRRDLSFWDERANRWIAEEGTFRILVGSSSRDIRLMGELEYRG
ncbi:MAG: glycoside hydrolase family 3 C-terminal domain-containing protein [Thermoproteota archaeon]